MAQRRSAAARSESLSRGRFGSKLELLPRPNRQAAAASESELDSRDSGASVPSWCPGLGPAPTTGSELARGAGVEQKPDGVGRGGADRQRAAAAGGAAAVDGGGEEVLAGGEVADRGDPALEGHAAGPGRGVEEAAGLGKEHVREGGVQEGGVVEADLEGG